MPHNLAHRLLAGRPGPQVAARPGLLAGRLAQMWLLLALVLVPALGRWHQVTHADALDRVHAGHAASLAASEVHPTHPTHPDAVVDHAEQQHDGLFDPLLAHHRPVDCLVLDQLALGDVLHTAAVALPALLPAPAPRVHRTGRVGAQHVALFHARGPPAA